MLNNPREGATIAGAGATRVRRRGGSLDVGSPCGASSRESGLLGCSMGEPAANAIVSGSVSVVVRASVLSFAGASGSGVAASTVIAGASGSGAAASTVTAGTGASISFAGAAGGSGGVAKVDAHAPVGSSFEESSRSLFDLLR